MQPHILGIYRIYLIVIPKEEEETKKKEIESQEEKLLQHAASGFMEARMKEDFPMCGMDESIESS